ncbi:MAG: elongation factor P [Synergistaceae bacterium]|nr:elongation factor P [Synergistaceae bacterium]
MAQMVDTSDFRPGLKIKWEGGMWVILECSHHKMGRGGAIVRGKLRNLETGAGVDQSFKSGERFERIVFDEKPAQYQYKDGDRYVFMDMESYDQVYLSEDVLGDAAKYLVDDLEVSFDMYEGRVMGIELPNSVPMKITDTPPGFKGDTASGGGKPATTSTGLNITVPFFVENGEMVLVDTRTGEYLERAKK